MAMSSSAARTWSGMSTRPCSPRHERPFPMHCSTYSTATAGTDRDLPAVRVGSMSVGALINSSQLTAGVRLSHPVGGDNH